MAPFTRVQVEKCDKCLVYYPSKTIHQCMPVVTAIEDPKKSRKILPAESTEKKVLLLSSDDDVEDNKVNDFNSTSSLISAIKVRRPLFDHRMSLSLRSELVKNKLWDEVYTELQGEFTIDELKKKWKYLKEKYVRVRQQQLKSGINKRGSRIKWLHYAQLSFLEEVVTQHHEKKTTSILDSNLDNYSDDSPQSLTISKEQKRKEKNDHNFRRHLLSEHKIPRPAELNEDPLDPDVAFGNYLVALMKDLPKKKRKKFQCQFIAYVISAQELE
ncbi:uncharacterized protein LOC132953497 isoform X2 [Metopolophium dirhodum]|uniref:uncharacterized protein LOC132953497 isoform X2 n=1 Tax=Metopolophium dirhodum TaxID=44670 RepID=UPI00298F6B30|nr:uncharacterized protein LOC132953497 isoform X2 [Metopolophium dirhodum]